MDSLLVGNLLVEVCHKGVFHQRMGRLGSLDDKDHQIEHGEEGNHQLDHGLVEENGRSIHGVEGFCHGIHHDEGCIHGKVHGDHSRRSHLHGGVLEIWNELANHEEHRVESVH